MRLRHLRYFLAIAHERNMTRAAAELRMAQPALSRQMHELEREFGVPLLDRHPRGVAPTAAGEALARGSAQLIADVGAALDRAEATATGRRGRVVIGMPRVALVRGVADALAQALRDAHPEVTMIVREVDPVQVWEQVASGELDLGISVYPPKQAGIQAEPLLQVTFTRAVISASHPLAARERVNAAELGALPFLVAPRGLPKQIIDAVIAQLKFVGMRSPLLTVDTGWGGAQMMVAAGRGWFVASETLSLAPPAGTATPIMDGLNVPIIGAVGWRRTERRPVVRTLIELTLQFSRGTPGSRVREKPELPPAAALRAGRRREPGSMPIELELRHLQAILEIAAAQSIGRAAERLGLTQPALSRQIKELERAVGFALLVRNPRGVSLTAGGTALASECPALLSSVERLKRETTRARRGMEGRCVIGAVTTIASTELLANVLTRCAVKHPHLEIMVDEMPTPTGLAALRQGRIDVGLLHSTPLDGPEPFRREQLKSDRIDCALVGVNHPLAGRDEISPADLAAVPFLFMERSFNPPFYDLVMRSLANIGPPPLVEATFDGLHTVWSIAAQGRGWCLGFRSQFDRPPHGTVAVRIKGFDVPWGLDVVWRKDEKSAVVKAVVEAFRAVASSME